MASLPDTSRVSQLPSNPTSYREGQSGEPTGNETQALSNSLEHGHRPKDHVTRTPVSPKDTASESITNIAGGSVAGIALAISHHFFLAFLNGRNIDEYPQYWVKNANNAFSALLSMCIAFVATQALLQTKWRVARSKPFSWGTIDDLFALPAPCALFTTAARLRSPLLLPIFASIFIQSLALVSVFAPNALTVSRSEEIWRDISVPTLDLSKGRITSTPSGSYTAASPLWNTILTSIMLQPPNWKIPPGCGATCKFDLVYDGPGLQCVDTPSIPLPYTGIDEPTLVYNATSTLYQSPGTPAVTYPSSHWEIKDPYELRIGYISTDSHSRNTGRDGGSVYCVFRNATYKASIQVENNTMQVKNSIESYGDILGTAKHGESDFQCSGIYSSEPCFINGVNTQAMCEVFASAFTGTIQHTVYGGVNVAVLALLFSHDPEDMDAEFSLAVTNLSESLVSLFSNLTLGFIPQRNETMTVRAEIWDGTYAWSYTVWILWAVYLPTLLLASLVILNGLLSIRSNRRGMDDKVSNFFLAARNVELGAEDFELQQVHLLY